MTRTQTMVQLTEQLVEELDVEAERAGVSRSAVIRAAVTAYLQESGRAAIDRAIVEGYQRIPPAEPDAWGSLDALTDAAAVDVLHSLDAEERAAGYEPW